MKNKYYLLLIVLLSSVFFSTHGSATFITFKAEGTENIPDDFTEDLDYDLFLNDSATNFFNITFDDGNPVEFISKIIIDLRAGSDIDAIFDPSDGFSDPTINNTDGSGKGFGPVVGAGLLDDLGNVIAGTGTTGLEPANVMFNLSTISGSSQVLEITFINEDFNPNDILSFGIDIDRLGASGSTNQKGGLFGSESVGLTTFLSGTCEESVSSTFSRETENRSVSKIDICAPTTSVSEPNILLLILSGLGLVYIFSITRLE